MATHDLAGAAEIREMLLERRSELERVAEQKAPPG
jgi:hypothetical protein